MKRIMSEMKPCESNVCLRRLSDVNRCLVYTIASKRYVDVCNTIFINMYNNPAVSMACLLSCSCLLLTFGPVTEQPSKYLSLKFLDVVGFSLFDNHG